MDLYDTHDNPIKENFFVVIYIFNHLQLHQQSTESRLIIDKKNNSKNTINYDDIDYELIFLLILIMLLENAFVYSSKYIQLCKFINNLNPKEI